MFLCYVTCAKDISDYNQSNMAHCGDSNVTIRQTPIQAFYAGQSIFITGGTGFLGKILIEKLLRSCPDVSKIYVMVRSKKDKSAATRLDEIFESPVSISIIFHLAANIRFNNDIKSATVLNVVSTRAVLNLAKCMPNLKSFIHVSTIYTNCLVKHGEERFYKYLIKPEEFITLVQTSSESMINETLSRNISQWPNSYTFTKAIAEIVVKNNGESLPIGIFRLPAGTARGMGGQLSLFDRNLAPVSKGLLRFIMCNSDCKSSVTPVDITINALIARAWDVFNQPQRRGDNMLIYNYVSTNDAPLTYGDFFFYAQLSYQKYPIKSCYWVPTLTDPKQSYIYNMHLVRPPITCFNYRFLWKMHRYSTKVYETLSVSMKKYSCKRYFTCFRMWKLYKRIHDYCNSVEYFLVREWTYTDNNVHAMWQSMSENDQLLFNFNLKGFNWLKHVDNIIKGMRLYLFKEDLSTLEASRIKWKRLYWIHHATKFVFIFIVV
ncbi:PREDICTED: putative fatty acyl-CoA reductase CG5065 [Dinoponera quadriceps]|uniref:Fatty acyl-CoA reductase n=1 Tax=Dinoponera quadriceps TaxID=609295 RepID=A0A6P3Y1T7_DINQU|nr:PREDICTED: putative fatty acyl-CoA reductase CG5065 [Dinoponera quadriceps]